MSFGIPVRNGLSVSLVSSTFLSSGRRLNPALNLDFLTGGPLDPRITFSRTSQATLVDSTGKLTYAPNNLLLNSETFEAAAWAKANASVSANASVAPDGTTTADKLVPNTTSASHAVQQSVTTSGAVVISFYAKPAGYSYAVISSSANNYVYFDVANGVVASTAGTGWSSPAITSVGNGWYRCSAITSVANTRYDILCYNTTQASGNIAPTFAGDGTSGIFIWGAQLEQVTYQTTPGTYNSTSPKNLLGYTQEFDNAAWTKSNAFVQTNLLTYSEAFDNAAWSKGAATITADADIAPNGTSTADAFVELAINTAHSAQQSVSFVSGVQYTLSLYIKAGLRTWAQVLLPSAAFTSQQGGYFDLTGAGALGTTNGTPTSRTITAVGGGWYRITITATATATATDNILIRASTNGSTVTYLGSSASPALYLWGAQLVQGSTAGDYQRTDAAAAAVQYVAPDGSRTADKLVETTVNGGHYVLQSITALAIPYTFSAYVKAAERTFAMIYNAQTNAGQVINLATGALAGNAGLSAPTSSSVTDVGNGWYLLSMTITATAASNNFRIYAMSDATTFNYAGDGTSGIYIWGAQLSNSASLDPYVYNPVAAPTSAAYYGPRFDYDPVTLANKGLLIEEQRTNLLTYSEQFDNAAWPKQNATVTANAIVAPDGTTTADKLAEDASNTSHRMYQTTASAIANGTTVTNSVFLKAAERTWGYVRLELNDNTSLLAWFNLATGTIGTVQAGLTATMTSFGNGWYRCTVTGSVGTGATPAKNYFLVGTATGDTIQTYTGTSGSGIYVWGAQLEAGSFATSYIPTVASQVTRTADVALMQGANFSNWYNPNGGTIVVSASQPTIFASSRSTTSISLPSANVPRITTYRQSAGGVNFYAVNSAVVGNAINSGVTATAGVIHKTAASYNATSQQTLSVNGSAVAVMNVDMASDLGRLNSLSIGSDFIGSTNSIWCGHIQGIAYYPTVLANAQLQSLTAQSTIPSLSLDFTTQVFNVG